MSPTSNAYFLCLSALGFNYLWGEMLRNGTAQAIQAVKMGSAFPDGTILRRHFTGISVIDEYMLSPVIFYDGVTKGQNPAHLLMLVSLFSTMQSTSVCMLVSSWRQGRLKWWATFEYIAWGVLNQAWGAAFVYPLWCLFNSRYISARTGDDDGVGPITGEESRALLVFTIISCAIPIVLLYPAYFTCSISMRHGLIAFYRFSPVALGFLQPLVIKMVMLFNPEPMSQEQANQLVRTSLVLSGSMSALSHLYVLATSILSSTTSLSKVFLPSYTNVDKGSATVIPNGAHKFLQYDWIVVAAALIPFAFWTIRLRQDEIDAYGERDKLFVKKASWLPKTLTSFTLVGLLFSPGAVLPCALATKI